jgi:hypothetical protein
MQPSRIPIYEARHYVPDDQMYVAKPGTDLLVPRADDGVVFLPLRHMLVLPHEPTSGRVVLRASGPRPPEGYAYEYEFEPDDARRLAIEVIAMAHEAEVGVERRISAQAEADPSASSADAHAASAITNA